jgi:iron complex transport system ATP-binding protein
MSASLETDLLRISLLLHSASGSFKIVRILPGIERPTPPLLALHDVTVIRGESAERPALDGVSLRIGAGEHVCILGPNGCGKSTLIKTITRECYPVAREGSSISILGRERWNIFELRSLLGIVSPDLLASCTTDATGRDVVLSGFFSSTRIFPHHHPDPEHLARAETTLARLGIAHLAGRAVSQMSSGEAKRTLIARALVHDPQTLLFDEPSNALDIAAQFQLRDTMRDLAKSGLGILLVTHHVSEIIPEIERVVLLQAGRILADGSKQEILTAGHLSSLFGVPVRLVQQDGYFHLY